MDVQQLHDATYETFALEIHFLSFLINTIWPPEGKMRLFFQQQGRPIGWLAETERARSSLPFDLDLSGQIPVGAATPGKGHSLAPSSIPSFDTKR